MTTLTLSEIAKTFSLNRSTIYRAISSGRLSRRSDGYFDLSEVIRCFGEPKKVEILQHNEIVAPQQALLDELERVKKEFADYKNKAEADKQWLQTHLDRVTNLLEMKASQVDTSQQQDHATTRNNDINVDNKGIFEGDSLRETLQQQQVDTRRDTAHVAQQQPKNRGQGLLGRVIRAVFD